MISYHKTDFTHATSFHLKTQDPRALKKIYGKRLELPSGVKKHSIFDVGLIWFH